MRQLLMQKNRKSKSDSSAGKIHIGPAAKYGGLILIAMLVAAGVPSSPPEGPEQLIFVSSDGCDLCPDLKPFAMEAAELLGVAYYEGAFNREVPFPGYVLYLDGNVSIAGFNSELLLFQSICDLTSDDSICLRAEQAESIDGQLAE